MEIQYNIIINIKTPEGMLEIGDFLIGDDEDFAHTTFGSLNGYSYDEQGVLRIDLVKKRGRAPAQYLESISCTLDEYVENCRIITRNAFKYFTLERRGLDNKDLKDLN